MSPVLILGGWVATLSVTKAKGSVTYPEGKGEGGSVTKAKGSVTYPVSNAGKMARHSESIVDFWKPYGRNVGRRIRNN